MSGGVAREWKALGGLGPLRLLLCLFMVLAQIAYSIRFVSLGSCHRMHLGAVQLNESVLMC